MKLSIPLSLDPKNLDRFYRRDGIFREKIRDAELDALHGALTHAHDSAAAILEARSAISGDVTRTPESRALDVRRLTLKKGEAAAAKLDAAKARVSAERERLELEITAPRVPTHLAGLATEVRARLSNMADDARNRVLKQAFDKGDDLTLGAFLSAPGYLSGATDDSQAAFRLRWQHKAHPDALERLGRVGKALEAVERAGRSLVSLVTEISENPTGAMAERAKAIADKAMQEAESDAA